MENNQTGGAEAPAQQSHIIKYAYALHSCDRLETAIKDGSVIVGKFNVFKRWGMGLGFVRSPDLPCDVVINRPDMRGIAMHGDVVAVELLPRNQWQSAEADQAPAEDDGSEQQHRMPLTLPDGRRVVRCLTQKAVDVHALPPERRVPAILGAPERHDWPAGLRPVGRVVAVISRELEGLQVARLSDGVLRPGEHVKSDYGYRFKPYNPMLPQIVVYGRDIPAPYHDNLRNYLLLIRLDSRDGMLNIFKGDMICGRVERILGSADSVEANTCALRTMFGIHSESFDDDVEMCVPDRLEIPSSEELALAGRRDLREEEFVCTIDPATARDLDDALSIRKTANGGYHVGVHIADVSHFVRTNTPLDEEARERSTSTYFVDRVVPMLPRKLCEDYCSLNPSEDKFAFSALFELDRDAHVVSEWFGQSVIRSRCRLAYEQAQQILDGETPELDLDTESAHMGISSAELLAKVSKAVKLLFEVSSMRRRESLERGRLTIGNSKLGFVFEDMNSKLAPQGFFVSHQIDANWLVEEMMLLANCRVAEKIVQYLPDGAFLRHHLPPERKKMGLLNSSVSKCGINFRGSSAKALQETLDGAKNSPYYDPLCQLMKYSLKAAQYLANDTEDNMPRSHFALGLPWYTHFTSPIRRYCDVMVHRQLQLVLEVEQLMKERGIEVPTAPDANVEAKPGTDPFSLGNVVDPDTLKHGDCYYSKNEVEQIAEHCNSKREDARRAGDKSSQLFLCLYLQALQRKAVQDPRMQKAYYTPVIVLKIGEGSLLLYSKEIASEVEIGTRDTAQRFALVLPPPPVTEEGGGGGARNNNTAQQQNAKANDNRRNNGGKRDMPRHGAAGGGGGGGTERKAAAAPVTMVSLSWGMPPQGGEEVLEKVELFSEMVVQLVVSEDQGMMTLKMIVLPPWEREEYVQSGNTIPTSLIE